MFILYLFVVRLTICFMFQGAITQILENTKEDFFSKIINIIREAADLCYDRIKEIPCITCPYKPEGSMYAMVNHIHDIFCVPS
jgi:aspartate/methionine/tyrosine aminotransferase